MIQAVERLGIKDNIIRMIETIYKEPSDSPSKRATTKQEKENKWRESDRDAHFHPICSLSC